MSTELPFNREEAVRYLRDRDKALREVIDRSGEFDLSIRPGRSVFEVLLRSIVYQQLSDRAASTIFGRVAALSGDDGLSPDTLGSVSEADLRAAGLSAAKLRAARDLSRFAVEGRLPSRSQLETMDDESIVSLLTEIRGVGPWTVHMLLIFFLGRPDVLPVSDLGVRKGFMQTYQLDALPDAATLSTHAEIWRPFRSVACWYLWRAVDLRSGTQVPGI